jgi:hypothetical protein
MRRNSTWLTCLKKRQNRLDAGDDSRHRIISPSHIETAGTSNLNGQLTLRTRNNLTGKEHSMHSVIYLVGLIVVVMLILSALGLR